MPNANQSASPKASVRQAYHPNQQPRLAMLCHKAGVMAAALLIAGCERDGGIIGAASLPDIQGKFVIEDDRRTTPLTAAQHLVYYVVGTDRMLIFKGRGGPKPKLSLLGSDAILVRYCGGQIELAESFLEKAPNTSKNARLLRVQPVTSAGLTLKGQPIC